MLTLYRFHTLPFFTFSKNVGWVTDQIIEENLLTFGYDKNSEFVGNKAKGRIPKRVFQENKARQIFRKTKMFVFRKIWRVLFS